MNETKSIFKRLWFRIVIVIVAIVALYFIFNQFDGSTPAEYYTEKDLNPLVLDNTNGFYRLWTLAEPYDVDIQSDAVLDKYRRLFDPAGDHRKHVEEWDLEEFKKMDPAADLKLPYQTIVKEDWSDYLQANREQVLNYKEKYKVSLQRYRRLIESDVFQDFTAVDLGPKLPVPNLLAWLRVCKLYIAVNILDAHDGNWEQGASNIIDNLLFYKKNTVNVRPLITNLISKAHAAMSAEALASLMNHPECPESVFRMIFDRLPDRGEDDFGTKNSYVWEKVWGGHWPLKELYLQREYSGFEKFLVSTTFQPNRTYKYFHEMISTLVKYEKIPPHQWPENVFQDERLSRVNGAFWWLRNPGGKIMFEKALKSFDNLSTVIWKGYRVKTVYDMVRISAELHLEYNPEKSIGENLKSLDTYNRLLDPCSGKPYKWNKQKQVLYSFATDGRDNNGETKLYKSKVDVDFVVPLLVYVK